MALQKTHKVFISYLQKHFNYLFIVISLFLNVNYFAQTVIKEFNQDSISVYLPYATSTQNKIILSEYNNAIKIALLYYPELEKTKIKFRIRKQASPLAARPSVFAIFRKASKRKYIITISNKTGSKFSTIMLSHLSFNSQIGVIGHELGHISDYNKKHGFYFIKLLFMHLSKKVMDKFEYHTDMCCIDHGLGYQLLSWSKEVRLKLNLVQWKGIKQLDNAGRERYMNPESIIKEMMQNKIYN